MEQQRKRLLDSIEMDESIDLNGLMMSSRPSNSAKPADKKLSPLEEARIKKQSGLVVNTKQIEENAQPKPLQNFMLNETRMRDISEWEDDMNAKLEKRKHLIVTRIPKTHDEYAELIDEIDCLVIDENGDAHYNMTEDVQVLKLDEYGNEVPDFKQVTVDGWRPKYTRIRTKNDPPYTESGDKQFVDVMNNSMENKQLAPDEGLTDAYAEGVVDTGVVKSAENERKRISYVNVIIDKTGIGAVQFTDEERAKMTEADEILLTTVKKVDLKTIKVKSKKDTPSFREFIEKQSMTGGGDVTICLPATGRRVHMLPMSYGEFGDVAFDMETVTYDQYWKRLSILYNKMKNDSRSYGDETFDEWLNQLAYTDIQLAMYGLFISTFPDVNTVHIRCGKEGCKRSFDWSYDTRSIIQLDKCDDVFLKHMNEIATASVDKLRQLSEDSPVNNSNRIELPYSKFVVDIGIVSAKEFVTNVIPLINEQSIQKELSEESDGYKQNMIFLTTVRAIYIPDKYIPGEYIKTETWRDILDALYIIPPNDIQLLISIAGQYIKQFTPVFEFRNVRCPYCGNVTKGIPVTIDDLVFQQYQALMSTSVNVKNMPSL